MSADSPEDADDVAAAGELDLLQTVATFLAVCRTACLATIDDDGAPHAANVQYASSGITEDVTSLSLIFVSAPSSAHAWHIARRPDVALTIYAHDDRPEQIHGLQIHARCATVEASQRDVALMPYLAKYPFVNEPPYRDALERQSVYRVEPTWIRWIDNRRGFGFRQEWRR